MKKVLSTILAIILTLALGFVFAFAYSTNPEATLNFIRVGGKVFSIALLLLSVATFLVSIVFKDDMGPEKAEKLHKKSIFGIILSMVLTTICVLI